MHHKKINLDNFFTCPGCKPGRHFLSSCSEVNSTGYSEFDEPISARRQRYPLPVLVYTNKGQSYSKMYGI